MNKIFAFVLAPLLFMAVSCDSSLQQNAVSSQPGRADFSGASRLSTLLGDGANDGFPLVTEMRRFVFPQDHGPHVDYRNEWWYVTGNLDGDDGARYGFELTFFRFALLPASDIEARSAWKTNQVYIAHFAVTDVVHDEFHVAQRYSRGGAGLAGSDSPPFKVWLDDWSIAETKNDEGRSVWKLIANAGEFALELHLDSLKNPVLNGRDGLSQKSAKPGNASYYYSLTRLGSSGTLRIGDRTVAVKGLSWLDREWGSSALSSAQKGWDWFALQLDDGSELMLYNIRRNDGSADTFSAATRVDAGGNVHRLTQEEFSIDVRDHWQNENGDAYPASWRIEVPSLALTLDVLPAMSNQELVTNVRYWEGAVDVHGTSGGDPAAGRGYVELTGYVE